MSSTENATPRQASGTVTHRTGGTGLTLRREYPVSAARLWQALASSQGLGTWIGVFDGDPTSGSVQFRMTAESIDAAPMPTTIHRCEPGRAFDVQTDGAGGIRIIVDLVASDLGTRLDFTHLMSDPAAPAMWGPGWEYYLDRLGHALSLAGEDGQWPDASEVSPTVLDFNEYPEAYGAYYAGLRLG